MQTETLDLMLEHRSIRTFTDERIPEDTLHLLIKAAQAAATSSFQQCVSLVHVSDNTLREALVPLTHNQTYVATAPHFFVFCADYARHLQIVPDGKVGYTEQLLTAAIDAGLSAQNMLLAAQSYGYGGVYIGAIRNHPKDVCALLALPKHVFPLFGLCLGKPAEQPELKPPIPEAMFLHENQYHPFAPDDLAQYDATVEDYYQHRASQWKATNWSSLVEAKLEKESRPFMLGCLQAQEFAEK